MPENEWEQRHRLGYAQQLLGQWEKARQYYGQALALKPGYAPTQLALAQWQMRESHFQKGRNEYESRFAARGAEAGFDWRNLPIPRWHGEKIAGKFLHLWAEQGFGDVIMYAGFLPHLLAQKPARVTLSMFPKMMSLFARSFPQIRVESLEDIGSYALAPGLLESFPQLLQLAGAAGITHGLEKIKQDYERAKTCGIPDFSAPMGDLMVYGLPEIIPARHEPYLIAHPARIKEIKNTLQSLGPGRRIGLSWQSSNTESGHARSISLAEWLPLLQTPNCHFISLQHHVTPEDIRRFNDAHACRITDLGFDPVQDTEMLAALAASLDEIITIDNSNVHLAGALGIPATLLLPAGYDFRWPLLQNNETLWYNSVKTERQETPGDWQPVIARVAAELQQRSGS